MSVSGTTSYTLTQYQLVLRAFNILNVNGIGRTPSAEDISLAVDVLNMMLKAWGTDGLHLWCKTEGILYVQQYKSKYGFGNSSSIGLAPANATYASNAQMTLINASTTSATTSITVLNSTGFTVNSPIGIVQNDNSLFWTTIASIPSPTVINLNVATNLPLNLAAPVYSYTQTLSKFYRVNSARFVKGFDYGATSSINEILMNPLSHSDYYALPIKSINGLSNQYYYDPQLDYGTLSLWPRPNDCNYRVHFTFERTMDDVINPNDSFDLPQEWLEPVTWQLALRLIPAFGKEKKAPFITDMAEKLMAKLLDFDKETTGVSFQPDRDGGGIY